MLGGGDLDGDVSKQLELSNHRFFFAYKLPQRTSN